MRCHTCRRLSFSPICRNCRELYLCPEPKVRTLETGLKVVSFFSYDEIEPFLLTKHTPHGWFVYRVLAKVAFATLERSPGLSAIPVDDAATGGYSHTAVLAKELRKWGYRPLFGALRARNRVSYAGQSRAFRVENPRNFVYNGLHGVRAVLVDDIVTTGLTLQEAHGTLMKMEVEVSEALVLADVDR